MLNYQKWHLHLQEYIRQKLLEIQKDILVSALDLRGQLQSGSHLCKDITLSKRKLGS